MRLARETFDATGELRDSASPELGRLRRERDQVAARAREAAERILRSEEFAPYLQDQFVTLREDRFVLPLRASFKSMGLGIVHDTSRTGRDRVRRADRAGRAEQPAQGRRARHPPREPAHPRGAGGGGLGRGAAPARGSRHADPARRDRRGARAWRRPTAASRSRSRPSPSSSSTSCATRCSPCARPARS